jgi:hypothetical protein
LNLLKLSLVMATPSDPKQAAELSAIAARLDGTYGKGKWCADPEALTGSRQMDATAILDYFAPLKAYLDTQLNGQPVGW